MITYNSLLQGTGFTNVEATAGYQIVQDSSVNGQITLRVTGAAGVPATGSWGNGILVLAALGAIALMLGRRLF